TTRVPQFPHKHWSISASPGDAPKLTRYAMSEALTPNGRAAFTRISAYGAEFQARGKAVSANAEPKNRLMREQLIARLKSADPTSDSPPVVSLEDYFEGNTQEDSIAPNQIGFGRPSLERMYEILKAIKARPDVQTVVVGLHPDWTEAMNHPDVWPAGDHIHI